VVAVVGSTNPNTFAQISFQSQVPLLDNRILPFSAASLAQSIRVPQTLTVLRSKYYDGPGGSIAL
jgi:hypothetical protein